MTSSQLTEKSAEDVGDEEEVAVSVEEAPEAGVPLEVRMEFDGTTTTITASVEEA